MRSTRHCARTSANTRCHIEDLELVDYKVRILNGGTGATTRVLIESRDGDRRALVHHWRVAQHRRCLV
jgi:hypothetical protein